MRNKEGKIHVKCEKAILSQNRRMLSGDKNNVLPFFVSLLSFSVQRSHLFLSSFSFPFIEENIFFSSLRFSHLFLSLSLSRSVSCAYSTGSTAAENMTTSDEQVPTSICTRLWYAARTVCSGLGKSENCGDIDWMIPASRSMFSGVLRMRSEMSERQSFRGAV